MNSDIIAPLQFSFILGKHKKFIHLKKRIKKSLNSDHQIEYDEIENRMHEGKKMKKQFNYDFLTS